MEGGIDRALGDEGLLDNHEAKPLRPVDETFCSIPNGDANYKDLDRWNL